MDPELELLARVENRGVLVQQRQRFKGHEKAVTNVCIGAENDMLYSCGEDAIVRGWNLSSGRCDLKCEGHESPVNGCALDPEQRLLFSASNDSTARAWDAKRGKELLMFEGHEDSVMGVIEMNGTLYTASGDTTARAWDVNTGDEMTVFRGHESALRGLAMAEGVLYTCGWDNNAIGWDARTGAELARYPHPDGVLAVTLLDDMLFTACWDGKARAFDIRTGDELQTFEHPDGVVDLCIPESSGGMLFTAGWDGVTRAWDARGGRQLLSFGEQAAKKKTSKASKKAAGATAQDSGKGSLKSLAVEDGELYTTNDKVIVSWCWEREPLVLAAAAKDNNLLTELLDAGAVVDAQGNVRDRTALMHAALSDNAPAARALLDSGADYDAEDTLMKTPVDYAAEHSQEVSELIINAVEAPMADWDTPLCKLLLASVGLNEYISLFEDLDFDGETMMLLDDESLRLDLGIKRGNHRKALLKAIAERVKRDAGAGGGGGGKKSSDPDDESGGSDDEGSQASTAVSSQTADTPRTGPSDARSGSESEDEDTADGDGNGDAMALVKHDSRNGSEGGGKAAIGANYDEYGRRRRDSDRSSAERGGKGGGALSLGRGNQVMAELVAMREAMHGDNAMTQRQLAMMQDENRKMRAENVSLRDQLVETRELLEEIRDRSVEAMNSMEAGAGAGAAVGGAGGGDGSPKSPSSGSPGRRSPTSPEADSDNGGSKACVVQ
jgi:ankyrin repeat protein